MNEAEILSIKQRFGIIGHSPQLNHAINVAIQVAPFDKKQVLHNFKSGHIPPLNTAVITRSRKVAAGFLSLQDALSLKVYHIKINKIAQFYPN